MADAASLNVRMESPAKSPCRIVRVALESSQGNACQSYCWEAEQLHAGNIRQSEGRVIQELTLDPPARMFSPQDNSPAAWQLKILLEDKQGRRAASWIALPAPPKALPQPAVPVAARQDHSVL